MKIEFDVKLTSEDMFDFLMYHSYSAFSGIFSIFLGIGAIVLSVFTWGQVDLAYSLMYFAFGLIFLFYTPVTLKVRSKSQLKNSKVFENPIIYVLGEETIQSIQGEAKEEMAWANIMKVRSTKKSIIIYVTRIRAVILPKKAMGEQYSQVVELIKEKVEPVKVKIK